MISTFANSFKIKWCVVLILIISLSSCKKQAEEIKTQATVATMDSVSQFESNLLSHKIDSLIKDLRFNGTISIKKGQFILYEKSRGLENFQNSQKLDSASLFAIGSVSKQLTSTLILKAFQNQKLDLTDSLSKFIAPLPSAQWENITIHQLLTHSSGISDGSNKLAFKPGTDYLYSNEGYNLLGEIASKVENKTLDELYSGLFAQAEMKSASTPNQLTNRRFASAYTWAGKDPVEVNNMPKRLLSSSIGLAAGGVLSSVRDLHAWNENLYGGKIIPPDLLELMQQTYQRTHHYILNEIGYGYGIMSRLNPPHSHMHTGYVKGSASLLIYYPKSQTSVVVLSNLVEERLGKKHIFEIHQEVREFCDLLEISRL